jgi:hypothetical protein
MSLTYSTYVAELALLTQFNATDPNFTANLQPALDYAQGRIDRELNLLNTVASNSSLVLTAGSRQLNFSTANINVLETVNLIMPAGTTNPELGARSPLTIASLDYLNAIYGSAGVLAPPQNFAMFTDSLLLLGPWPDAAYTVELVGSMRPLTLSAGNPTTWVSTNLPDLLLAASMVWMAGFMKNFGAQADDPKIAMSWETQFTSLRDSAMVEDARRKFKSSGWTSELSTPLNPPRT